MSSKSFFSNLKNNIDTIWARKIAIIVLFAFVFAWVTNSIVLSLQIMPLGLSSTINGITRILEVKGVISADLRTEVVFPLMNLAANIPIIMFAFWKLRKRFAINTTIFILTNTFFLTIIKLIPILKDYDLLGGIDSLELRRVFGGLIAGFLIGTLLSFVFKKGASSGGFDVISLYVAKKTSKPVAIWTTGWSFINVIIFSMILAVLEANDSDSTSQIVNNAWGSSAFLGTMLMMISTGIALNIIYTTTRKRAVTVITDDVGYRIIKNILNSDRYFKRGHTVANVLGGFSQSTKKEVRIILSEIESNIFFEKLREADINVFATKTAISESIVGNYATSIDENENDTKNWAEHKRNEKKRLDSFTKKNLRDFKRGDISLNEVTDNLKQIQFNPEIENTSQIDLKTPKRSAIVKIEDPNDILKESKNSKNNGTFSKKTSKNESSTKKKKP